MKVSPYYLHMISYLPCFVFQYARELWSNLFDANLKCLKKKKKKKWRPLLQFLKN